MQAAAPYTLRSLERMLGVRRSVVVGLIQAGYVSPERGARNEYRFSFRDVVLLRTAVGLQAANVPQRKLVRSLKALRGKLPEAVPLSGLRIMAVGDEVAVRDGSTHWEAQSGQFLLDFDVSETDGEVSFIARPAETRQETRAKTAADWFAEGEAAEGSDAQAAEAAYREVLRLSRDHVYAYVNLGALLCEAGRCGEAVALYEEAARLAPDDPLVHFNAAIALEDQHRDAEALERYVRCLALSPDLADAHFNAARLYSKIGDAQGSLRHFNAYRRLSRETGES